jgi:hypothetical protein
MQSQLEILKYNITVAKYETTRNISDCLLKDIPTLFDHGGCSFPICGRNYLFQL